MWIATIGDGSCVRFAAELSRMRRCPITVAREVQTGESVPIVHEMVVANPHSWLILFAYGHIIHLDTSHKTKRPCRGRIKSGKYIGYSEKYKKPGKKNATDGLEGKA